MWETALPAGKVRWEPSMRKIGSVPFSLRKIRIPVWWQMHYPRSIVWYPRAAGELSPDGMEMWRIRFLRFTHRSVDCSLGLRHAGRQLPVRHPGSCGRLCEADRRFPDTLFTTSRHYTGYCGQPPASRRESPSNYRERDRNISARTVIEEIYNFLRKM